MTLGLVPCNQSSCPALLSEQLLLQPFSKSSSHLSVLDLPAAPHCSQGEPPSAAFMLLLSFMRALLVSVQALLLTQPQKNKREFECYRLYLPVSSSSQGEPLSGALDLAFHRLSSKYFDTSDKGVKM